MAEAVPKIAPRQKVRRAARGLLHLWVREWGLSFLFMLFTLGVSGVGLQLMIHKMSSSEVAVPVLLTPKAPYNRIDNTDLIMVKRDSAALPTETIRELNTLSGSVALSSLPAMEQIESNQLITGPKDLLDGSVITSIAADSALVFGGGLRAGSIISAANSSRVLVDRMLVIDVKPVSMSATPGTQVEARYLIILAIPGFAVNDVIAASKEGTLYFAITR